MGRPVSEWDETDLMKAVYGLRQHGLLTRAACSHMIGMILDGTSVAVAQFGRDFGTSPTGGLSNCAKPTNP